MIAFRLAWMAVLVASCARHAGQRGVAGAGEGLREESERTRAETGQYPSELLGSRAARGALGEVTSPEQSARLQDLSGALARTAVENALGAGVEGGSIPPGSLIEATTSQAASAFEQQLVRALTGDLGPTEGDGPLGLALAGTTQRLSGAATRGLVQELFPECAPGEPGCLDRRANELGHRAAAGFMRGVREGVPWMLLAGVFLAGVITVLLVGVTVHLLRGRGADEGGAPRAARRHLSGSGDVRA
jgi:hypothetical protein